MCAAHVAQRVNHRQHDEAEGQRDADVGDRAAAGFVDDDRARPGEDEGERAEEFSGQLFHLHWRRQISFKSIFKICFSFFTSAAVSSVLARDL